MSTTNTDLKTEIEKKLNALRAMRDEVRVRLHLAGLDAKGEWNKLEPQITALEHVAEEFTEDTHVAVTKALKSLSDLKASMHI
jgi:hypothetical protein